MSGAWRAWDCISTFANSPSRHDRQERFSEEYPMVLCDSPLHKSTILSTLLTEVLQSKLHSSSQGETLALRLFHKPSKIKALNVFVVDLWSRLHLVYDRLCKTSVLRKTLRSDSFCTQSSEEKRVLSLPISGGRKRPFTIDNSANPLKSKQLALYKSFSVLI